MRSRSLTFLLGLFALMFCSTAFSAPPRKIAFQGMLTENQVPVTSSVQMSFRLYDAPTGGNLIWSETQTVAINKGVYSVQLGSVSTFDGLGFNAPYYLSIQVATGAEMTPRQPLLAAPYALHAESVSDGSITISKLGISCDNGQVLRYSSTLGWQCATAVGPEGPTGPTGPAGAQGPQGEPGVVPTDSPYYIQNTSTAQTANFNITGNGTVGGNLSTGGQFSGRQLNAASAPEAASASNAGKIYHNTSTGDLLYSDGSAWRPLTRESKGTYRWATWQTYDNTYGWFLSNGTSHFGGIAPSNWTDGNAVASSMSSDKGILGTLFNSRKTIASNGNSLVMAENYAHYSSTNGKVVAALFRIRNNTGSAINWTPYFYYTAYGSWGEYASLTLNGANNWNSGASALCGGTGCAASLTLSIPANRVSTVIVVATAGPATATGSVGMRTTLLAFYNNSLNLPTGLEYVDDLDTSSGSAWAQ